ncbi:MAG: hypothetical protein FJ316_12515 [SAR202 cluster bacterium]|nr:hypothetical protein [SAR202 cluster bacterium]
MLGLFSLLLNPARLIRQVQLGSGRVLLLGTYRDVELSRQHPLAETLGDLTRERLFQRVLLRGLSQEDVARFIEVTTGAAPPAGLAQAVYAHTEGNPLFVTEVVRLLVQEGGLVGTGTKSPQPPFAKGRLDRIPPFDKGGPGGISSTGVGGISGAWEVRIPEGVREVIGRRLNRLSQRCNQTLTTAAVLGREFSLAQLKPLIEDTTEDRLLEVLEEALAARVIEELPRSVGRYQFSHALIQETLAGELSTTRKVRLHARIAQALETLYGNTAEAHAAELARHFAEAESVLGAEKLVKYSLLAGEKALSSYAWEEALAHFQRGLTAKGAPLEGTEPAKDGEEAALLFGLGRAHLVTLERRQSQEGVDILSRAFDFYESIGDVNQAVAVAEYPLPSTTIGRTGVAPFVPRALKLVPPDSLSAGRLLSTYGRELGRLDNNYDSAQEAFARSLVIAQRNQDRSLEVRTLADSADVEMFQLHMSEAISRAEQAVEIAQGLEEQSAVQLAHLVLARALELVGESVKAQPHASAVLELAAKLRDRSRREQAFRVRISLSGHLGDWEGVRTLSEQALNMSPMNVVPSPSG